MMAHQRPGRCRGIIPALTLPPLALALFAGAAHGAGASLRTVALNDDPAPGQALIFTNFGSPVINSSGRVAFSATSRVSGQANSSSGIWSEGAGALALIVASGDPAPGGGNFGSFAGGTGTVPAFLSDNHRVAFTTTVGSLVGIWSQEALPLAQIARDGVDAPSLLPGKYSFGGLAPTIVQNNSGRVAFTCAVAPPLGPSFGAMFISRPSDPVMAARTALSTDTTGISAFAPPLLNDQNKVCFTGTTFSPNGGGTGIYDGPSGAINQNLVAGASTGTAAPSLGDGVFFLTASGVTGFNNSAYVGFTGLVSSGFGAVLPSNNWGVWELGNFGQFLAAREGAQIPDLPAGVTLREGGGGVTSAPSLSDNGCVAFFGTLDSANPAYNGAAGLFIRVGSAPLKTVALVGQSAPGISPPATIASFTLTASPTLNRRGQLVFSAFVNGLGEVVFVTDDQGNARPLYRPNVDVFTLRPGITARLGGLSTGALTPQGGSDGRRRAWSDRGELVVATTFSRTVGGGSGSGVFVLRAELGCNKADITDGSGTGLPDGTLSGSDVVAFFADFFAGCGAGALGPCSRADITDNSGSGPPDGLLAGSDVVAFFTALFAGCP